MGDSSRPGATMDTGGSHACYCGSCPCWPLVTALPATAARSYVRVVSVTHVVAKNDEATLVARVAPADAGCNVVVYLRSGPLAASGL
jgi:hypothetical protein